MNARDLARYARACQDAELVPIVEPEILMDGVHSLTESAAASPQVLRSVFDELASQGVNLDRMLLKPNMVLPGYDRRDGLDNRTIADATLAVFHDAVPASVPGIVFLSGGQSENQANSRLAAMVVDKKARPWTLSFSFGRSLQSAALAEWRGKDDRTLQGQQALLESARRASMAATAH